MLRKRTMHTRMRDNTLNGVTRFERLRDNMSKREARFRNGNQHVDDYMGNKYACTKGCCTGDVKEIQKIRCVFDMCFDL